MTESDWVLIIPGQEGAKVAAALLLELATTPADVRTTGNGMEFLVPPYLAELYNPTPAPTPAPAPKRRSRAKKEEENGD